MNYMCGSGIMYLRIQKLSIADFKRLFESEATEFAEQFIVFEEAKVSKLAEHRLVVWNIDESTASIVLHPDSEHVLYHGPRGVALKELL